MMQLLHLSTRYTEMNLMRFITKIWGILFTESEKSQTILCYQKAIELDSNNKQILIDYGLILEQQSK